MIAIKIDGNSKIGIGHIMRCHAIAREIENLNEEVIAFCSDEESARIIKTCGIKYEITGGPWNDLDSEIDNVISIIKRKKIKMILIDTYFVTEKYLSAISKHSKICYMDDLLSFKYPVNMLINYNISYKLFDYFRFYSDSDTKLVLGPQYAPLRREFFNVVQREIKDKVMNVLITTGGSDNYDICGALIEKIVANKELGNMIFHVISGPFFKSLDRLKEFSKKFANIRIHENITNMFQIMQNSDIAVSASGSTFLELCACGVPSIMFSVADNQDSILKEIKENNLALVAGKYDNKNLIDTIYNDIIRLSNDKELRLFYRQQMISVTDGRGAERLARQILSL